MVNEELQLMIYFLDECMFSKYFYHDYDNLDMYALLVVMTVLEILLRVVTKKFKLLQYFSWYHLLRKNEK